MLNENHLLLDSINCGGVGGSERGWGLEIFCSSSEVLGKHSLHVMLTAAEFPAIPDVHAQLWSKCYSEPLWA